MSKITGKRIGQLIISSDVVTTTSDVEQYVNTVSADLQQAIDDIGPTVVSGYVPTSRKINGTPLSGDINVGTITGITMNGASKGTAGNVNLGDVLTAVPSAYNTYDETKQSLSSDGYATQEQLNEKSAVSVDNAKADVNMVHISQAGYEQLVVDDEVLSNALYVVSADYVETYGQQIKNVAPGSDLSDAVNVEQLLSAVGNVQVPTDLSSFNNSPGYLVSSDISDYCKKSETSSASQISAADELLSSELSAKSSISVDTDFAPKFKFEHISLEDYISKSISGIVDGNTLYDISSENMTVFGQKIVDLAPGEDPTDAPNMSQLTEVSARACDTYTQAEVDQKIAGAEAGYKLVNAMGVLSSGSYVYEVQDKAMTTIGIDQSSTPVVVMLPSAGESARDFILRIEISSASAPTFTFANTAGLDFESEDDDWAVMEPGVNLVSFTETKR